ncbi:MAG: glycosyltransferase [Phycisphaerae bacterium]|jgi:glycosyltransferase involved in cell wall biosynthesis|nr:glycosyltransferase [Phycisphaerae bacterium]HOO17966.1 glycosyltransferase [Phycisphaerae bacterium]HPC23722.1 glycosyltransferase [Phycisphaerae bacterium]HRS28693.1 glycosyltransferase [Phycisphaerae bacterium]HRT43420.1 glycosyltransferase [Phycisphaerae bacterium]
MIDNRNIVCIASSWFDHPTSKHHVMRILAERNRVIWVNYHASRRPNLSIRDFRLALRRLRRSCAGPRRVPAGLTVLSPLLAPFPQSRLARAYNTRVMVRQIGKALAALPAARRQLWLFAPDTPELIRHFDFERVVYYCVDDFAEFSGYDPSAVQRLEAATLAVSDVVIATSTQLFEGRRAVHSNTHLVPHGVDFEHFAPAAEPGRFEIPPEMRHMPRPVLGYVGLISDYVDLELLAQAARARPAWSFVLVGNVNCALGALSGLPNVHLLGGRPYEDLPRYFAAFDVGLIPFRMNRLVRAVNPIKLREYLAAGLPVVSAPLEAVLGYAPAVYPAQNLEQFLAACDMALRENHPAARRARQNLVRAESWHCRVERISEIVSGGAARQAWEDRIPALPLGVGR